MNYKKTSRALSVNNMRVNITLEDVKFIAQKYTIRNYSAIVEEVQSGISFWKKSAKELGVSKKIIESIARDFVILR
jgi:hypothetical protein